METKIILGDTLNKEILIEVKTELDNQFKKHNKVPGIAFLGFLDVPLGKYNIPFHVQQAKKIGFKVFNEVLPEGITEEEIFRIIDRLNDNSEVHAIEVLQPLPTYLNPVKIINRIKPEKEVEGFHPSNMMNVLFPDIYESNYPMCLPTALSELFNKYKIQLKKDQEWVLILDDEFFYNPLVNMVTRTAFTKAVPTNCTLTIVNKQCEKIDSHCKRADFLVIVSKDPEFINPGWLKEGVCIIDIYANLVKEISDKNDADKLIPIIRGGINTISVKNIASVVFPIPGGLMNVVLAIMFRNALNAFIKSLTF